MRDARHWKMDDKYHCLCEPPARALLSSCALPEGDRDVVAVVPPPPNSYSPPHHLLSNWHSRIVTFRTCAQHFRTSFASKCFKFSELYYARRSVLVYVGEYCMWLSPLCWSRASPAAPSEKLCFLCIMFTVLGKNSSVRKRSSILHRRAKQWSNNFLSDRSHIIGSLSDLNFLTYLSVSVGREFKHTHTRAQSPPSCTHQAVHVKHVIVIRVMRACAAVCSFRTCVTSHIEHGCYLAHGIRWLVLDRRRCGCVCTFRWDLWTWRVETFFIIAKGPVTVVVVGPERKHIRSLRILTSNGR